MPRLTGFPPSAIPGPRALPGLGVHVNAIRLLMDPVGQLMALHAAHGDVVSLAAGSPALICAFGAERNREVLGNPAVFDNEGRFFLTAPRGTAVELFGLGLPFIVGETHRRHRRLMMPAFQKAVVEGYAADIVAVTARALDRWPVGERADVAALTRDLVQDVVIKVLFGLDPADDDGGLGPATTEMVDLVTNPWVMLPLRIPGTPYARLIERSSVIFAQLARLVAEKRRKQVRGRDALALMIEARDADGSSLSEADLLGEAATLYVGGHDTQARSLAWTLWLLEQHPRVLGPLVDELDAVLGGRDPTPEDLPQMPLLDRVIKESLRLIPPVPMLFLRTVAADTTLGGHAVPAGATVILSPWVTHRDPEVFPSPARFQPERWEGLRPSPHQYLPFGGGHRSCLGAGYAGLAMRLMLPMILQRYRLALVPGARISRRVRGNIFAPRYGVPMQIHRQDRQFVRCTDLRGDLVELVDLGET